MKENRLLSLFSECKSDSDIYEKIILLGKQLNPLPSEARVPENQVQGCQSITYLQAQYQGGLLSFSACSDAFISAGLAWLLIQLYSDEKPTTILRYTPRFIQELSLASILTPGRANGLQSMHNKMKAFALLYIQS